MRKSRNHQDQALGRREAGKPGELHDRLRVPGTSPGQEHSPGTNPTQTLPQSQAPRAAPGSGPRRGDVVDRYRISRTLGSGGSGVVYEALDEKLDRHVAIKLLRPAIDGRDHSRQRRLVHEAKALAALSHPAVVAIYDAGFFRERAYLVMERIEGQTLTRWLQSRKRSWQQILHCYSMIGRGLIALHRRGLVHRDVKPSNILVDHNGSARLIDLGLAVRATAPRESGDLGARAEVECATAASETPAVMSLMAATEEDSSRDAASEPGSSSLQSQGSRMHRAVGTPGYLAPEQISSVSVDGRADQFAFCAALWQSLYGVLPFGRGHGNGSVGRARTGRVDHGRQVTEVPERLRRALLRGLSFRPEQRYADMEELLAALLRGARRSSYPRLSAAAGFAALLLTVSWLPRNPTDAPCAGSERDLSDTWNATAATELQAHLVGLETPHAHEVAARVEQQLSSYSARWQQAHREVCEATRVRGEQSEKLMDLRMACLDMRRAELQSTVSILQDLESQQLSEGAKLAASLSSLEPCSQLASLAELEPLPTTPQLRQQLTSLRAEVAAATVSLEAGRYRETLPLSEETSNQARALGYRPLLAKAELVLARNHARLGAWPAMETALYRALAAAQAGHADREVARVWLELAIHGWATGQLASAERHLEQAEAVLHRLGGDLELRATLHHRRGMVHNRQRRFVAALEEFERSHALWQRLEGRDSVRRATVLDTMAIAHRSLGQPQRALELYREEVQIYDRVLGPGSTQSGAALANLGYAQYTLGRLDAAESTLEQSLSTLEGTLGNRHWRLLSPRQTLAEVLLARGQAQRAIPLLRSNLDLAEGNGIDPVRLANSEFVLARALAETSGLEQATEMARRARDRYAAAGNRAQSQLSQVESWIAAQS